MKRAACPARTPSACMRAGRAARTAPRRTARRCGRRQAPGRPSARRRLADELPERARDRLTLTPRPISAITTLSPRPARLGGWAKVPREHPVPSMLSVRRRLGLGRSRPRRGACRGERDRYGEERLIDALLAALDRDEPVVDAVVQRLAGEAPRLSGGDPELDHALRGAARLGTPAGLLGLGGGLCQQPAVDRLRLRGGGRVREAPREPPAPQCSGTDPRGRARSGRWPRRSCATRCARR